MTTSTVKRQRSEIDMRTLAKGAGATVDEMPRSSTAKARDECELSLIDARTFCFMVDEVPNFSTYIMRVLARRIRGMSRVM